MAMRLMRSPAGKAFDVGEEPAGRRDAYGDKEPAGGAGASAHELFAEVSEISSQVAVTNPDPYEV